MCIRDSFRSVLQFRLQIALSLRILLFVEVLAEAGAVVEPDLARQLLIAIRRMGDALADGGVSSKSAVESLAHRRSMLAQIQPGQSCVSLLPNRRHSIRPGGNACQRQIGFPVRHQELRHIIRI